MAPVVHGRYHIYDKGDAVALPPTPPTLTVRADRAVRGGEQIFETYGDNSNEIYFRHHGFVPDENPSPHPPPQARTRLAPLRPLYATPPFSSQAADRLNPKP